MLRIVLIITAFVAMAICRSTKAWRRITERFFFHHQDHYDLPPQSPSVESCEGSEPADDKPMEPTGEADVMTVWVRSFNTGIVAPYDVPASATVNDLKQRLVGQSREGNDADSFHLSQNGETPLDGGQLLADLGVGAEGLLQVVPLSNDVTQLHRDLGYCTFPELRHFKDQREKIIDKAIEILSPFKGKPAVVIIRFPGRFGLSIQKDQWNVYRFVFLYGDKFSDLPTHRSNARFLGYSVGGEPPESFKEITM